MSLQDSKIRLKKETRELIELKILITIPSLKDPGGVASYYNSVLPHLSEHEDLQIASFEIGSSVANNRIFHPILDQLKFIRHVKSKKFDLVHVNPSLNLKSFIRDGLFTFWAKRKKLPVIVFIHGWDESFYNKLAGCLYIFFRLTVRHADSFIVLAADFKVKLINKGIRQPIHVLTTAVDESLVKNFSIETKRDQTQKAGSVKILFLSRLEKEKGVFETIDACKLLIEKGYDVSLSIAGDGSAMQDVEVYIQLNGLDNFVVLLGYVTGDHKAKVFKDHDIYCFPTYYGEGLPTSVLEAMAFGMPVVTRPIGGIKDFFINGDMGYMAATTNPEEIAACLEKLVSDKSHICNVSKFNYDYAKKNFMASKAGLSLREIYELTLASSSK